MRFFPPFFDTRASSSLSLFFFSPSPSSFFLFLPRPAFLLPPQTTPDRPHHPPQQGRPQRLEQPRDRLQPLQLEQGEPDPGAARVEARSPPARAAAARAGHVRRGGPGGVEAVAAVAGREQAGEGLKKELCIILFCRRSLFLNPI